MMHNASEMSLWDPAKFFAIFPGRSIPEMLAETSNVFLDPDCIGHVVDAEHAESRPFPTRY